MTSKPGPFPTRWEAVACAASGHGLPSLIAPEQLRDEHTVLSQPCVLA